MNLAPLLNLEILRIAKSENKTEEAQIKALMEELAQLCGVSVRTLYHWRSGRHPLPGQQLPTLCRRFGSRALLEELSRGIEQPSIDIPDEYDLARLASQAVREDLAVYEQFLAAFESNGIQPGELTDLRDLGARIHRNVHQLLQIAEADCTRRLATDTPPRKGDEKARGNRDRATDGGSLIRAIK